MSATPLPDDAMGRESAFADSASPNESVKPWEKIDGSRYMPRRIRGSFPGRELG